MASPASCCATSIVQKHPEREATSPYVGNRQSETRFLRLESETPVDDYLRIPTTHLGESRRISYSLVPTAPHVADPLTNGPNGTVVLEFLKGVHAG